MKNKTALTLMELLGMVLVFSLAAAVCLQIFASAQTLSRETAHQDAAVLLAQNTAQRLKAGLPPQSDTGDYQVEVHRQDSGVPGLGLARISVCFEGEVLFSLNAGWQEELP